MQRPVESAQYTSRAFAEACDRLGITQSTGRTGTASDNAAAESFFSTLQHELIDRRCWNTKTQARQEITLWVHDWYNHHRLHTAIGMIPPIQYELDGRGSRTGASGRGSLSRVARGPYRAAFDAAQTG
ncbi:MAG: integrase core domain-containing protein [Acidimicrobiaceae bacterium]|nr:integrase core domain-containing protein [Acidimicrobiaceae bacterium]